MMIRNAHRYHMWLRRKIGWIAEMRGGLRDWRSASHPDMIGGTREQLTKADSCAQSLVDEHQLHAAHDCCPSV